MARAKTDPTKPRQPRTIAAGRGGEVVIYEDPERRMRVDVRLEQETVWLNLNQMAALFERDKSVISRHLRNVFRDGELDPKATVAKFATVQREGNREVVRQVEYYNLDAIISVGYRVNSKRGTQFRIWATQVLREHLVRGYTVNARHKNRLVYAADGMRRISNETLVALTLLLAQSPTKDKEALTRLVVALLNRLSKGEP
jgi:hypothetical protein